MEEWKEYRLGDFMEFNPTVRLPKNTMARKVTMDQLVPHCRDIYNWTYEPYSGGAKFQNGDTIMARITPCLENGKHAFVSFLADDEIAYGSTEYIVIRGRKEISDNLFVYYLSHYPEFKDTAVKSMVGSSGRQRAQVDVLENIMMFLPSLPEQQRIANFLSSLDDKIEVNRRINDNFVVKLLVKLFIKWVFYTLINDNLEQQAKAIFKSWLTNCQDEVTIGDLSLNITDYSKCNSPKVVLVNSSDVTNGVFDHHTLSDNMNLKGHFKKRFKKGDILYSQVRPRNRHWAYCTFEADHYLASTQLMVIRNKKEILPSVLLYQYLIEDDVWNEFTLKTETRSGTFPQGNYEDLSSIRVPFGAEMNNIIPELESLYALKYSIEKESRRLASLRDTLLPELMSGKLKMNELTV